MKKFVLVVAALAVGIAGYFGYAKYERDSLTGTLTPLVKNASIRVSNSSRLDLVESQITFKELFEKLDVDVAEIDKRAVDVQSISNSKNASITGPVTAYMQSAQEFSRALSMKYRKTLSVKTAHERYLETLREQISASGYERDYAVKRSERAEAEVKKADAEAATSIKELAVAAQKMKASLEKVSNIFPDDALVKIQQLDEIIKKNSVPPNEKS